MSELTEMLRRKGYDYDNTRDLTDAMNEAADIIDELEKSLREALHYVGVYESENFSNVALDVMSRAHDALGKLERSE